MNIPLATRIKPNSIKQFIGQEKLLGKGAVLRSLVESDSISSMIFWGPPGSGKTTLAEIIAAETKSEFTRISAVIDGKAELKKIIAIAEANFQNESKQTILFIDEIHRWTKTQQDALLPYVESGVITLIGATTENPSFNVISPLLSRAKVFVFEPHSEEEIQIGIKRGLTVLNKEFSKKFKLSKKALEYLSNLGNGDMRFSINGLEFAYNLKLNQPGGGKTIAEEDIARALQKFLRYDKTGEEHYNTISAVHKSMRSSNPSAAAYWVLRMLDAGDDPLYIARRLLRFASEDIGNANPNALLLANQVYETCHKLGTPECDTALVQLAEYLANSKKSNAAYRAIQQIRSDIKQYGNLPVPMHLRNAPTKLMKELDYGKGYEYDPSLATGKSEQQCLPDKLKNRDYFN